MPPSAPPPPPSPSIPDSELAKEATPHISSVTLSTYFLPETKGAEGTRRELFQAQYGTWPYFTSAEDLGLSEPGEIVDQIKDSLDLLPMTSWAGCSRNQFVAGQPLPALPCRTGVGAGNCVDGARRCGTVAENARDPFVEFTVDTVDTQYYLFTIEFSLPVHPVCGPLLFKPFEATGGEGYSVTVYDDHHSALSSQCQPFSHQNVKGWVDGMLNVQFQCTSPTATDRQLHELTRARIVRVVLPGENRQIWLDSVRVVYRVLTDVTPFPPPPPPRPRLPPQPVAPPDSPTATSSECAFFANTRWLSSQSRFLMNEPCSVTQQTCCEHAHANHATGFQLSASGCCTLLTLINTSVVPSVHYEWGASVSGMVV